MSAEALKARKKLYNRRFYERYKSVLEVAYQLGIKEPYKLRHEDLYAEVARRLGITPDEVRRLHGLKPFEWVGLYKSTRE